MEDRSNTEKKRLENIVLIVFTAYSLGMMLVSLILQWPIIIIPVIFIGILVGWFLCFQEYRTYEFRASMLAILSLIDFVMYGIMAGSFADLLPALAAVTVLLSIFNMEQVLYWAYLATFFLFVYHGFILYTIPFSTTLDKCRTSLQIISIILVEGVTYWIIKSHHLLVSQMQNVISDLTAAEQSKSDFMANVSHEIRTPINSICGMSEMVLRENLSDEVRENIFQIQTSGRELLSSINNILDFSELELERMGVVEENYSMASTINDIINTSMAKIEEKNLEFIVECDADIPRMLAGDEQKIRRVTLNLIENAIKFTEKGCIILKITTRKEVYGVNLLIKIRDTGVGISEENAEKLFNNFNQVDTRKNREKAGIGLGLAISKKIIEVMGGFISVQSEPDKGSEFQFVLPQKIVDERALISVNQAESKNILVYIDVEKYIISKIRDAYLSNIMQMAEQLKVDCVIVRSMTETKRKIENGNFTHLFLTIDEYRQDAAYFESLADNLVVTVIGSREKENIGREIQCIHKPFNIFSAAAILNGEHAVEYMKGRAAGMQTFVAPEANILVVDDNLMNLKVVEGLLRPYKIKIFTALSGMEAIRKLDDLKVDIIFMDHMMPQMDGVEAAHLIREKTGAYFKQVPIIALTANAIAGAREMFMEEGFQDFVAKPIEMSVMERVLKRHLPVKKILKTEKKQMEYKEVKVIKQEDSNHVNCEEGIKFCGGEWEDYLEVLQIYIKSGQEKQNEIGKMYEQKDWKNYMILVHALKSTSRGIGAAHLSELAEKLEAASREKDEIFILAHHAAMMEEYEIVRKELEKIKEANQKKEAADEKTEETAEQQTELTQETWKKEMETLRELLESCELQGITEKIESLSAFCYDGKAILVLLEEIVKKINDFDFFGAQEALEGLLQKMETEEQKRL